MRVSARACTALGAAWHLGIAALIVSQQPGLAALLSPSLMHTCVLAYAFLVRDAALTVQPSLFSRLVAYFGVNPMSLFTVAASQFAPRSLSPTGHPPFVRVAFACMVVGGLLGLWSSWVRHRAVKVEADARRPVTQGPYAIVRHPAYAGALVVLLGMLVSRPTMLVFVAALMQALCLLLRMRYEEQALSATFPEYRVYASRVGALVPRLLARS